MGLKTMRYKPLNFYDRSLIAPTEKDNYYRYQLVHGYVHDMGAAMTDGVGGHAGLFSNATDLAALMQMLLNKGVYGGRKYLSEEVISKYTSCQYCPNNRRGAGFDKPVRDLNGGPTCNLVSLESFGHSGFTGTQTWADPKYGINYVFLSNRVYPNAENWKLVKMSIRTEIQRVIYEAFLEAEKEK
jgi:CubicO group peptidase (beta-lactamase class C family)